MVKGYLGEILQQKKETVGKNITGDGILIHKPVMVEEVLYYLDVKPNGVYVDATIGCGGHAMRILEKLENGFLIGVDWDPEAIEIAREQLKNYKNKELICSSYTKLDEIIKRYEINSVDGILFDLGISLHQLSNHSRGFSFLLEGPLDMRFNKEIKTSAYEVINNFEQEKLIEIFRELGEERAARRIATEIIKEREKHFIRTTTQLSKIISRIKKRNRIHPATKVFQALRIYVNKELDNFKKALEISVSILKTGGRMVVISYHSLEDRIAKFFMKEKMKVLTKKPVIPTKDEIRTNPSSRSAKLRAAAKL